MRLPQKLGHGLAPAPKVRKNMSKEQTNGQHGGPHNGHHNGSGPMQKINRVVITGLGAITPVGLSTEESWTAVTNGQSGIDTITRFDTSELRTTFAGEVRGFDATDYLDKREVKRWDPVIHYTTAATQEALNDSGLTVEDEDLTRFGVVIASGVGGLGTVLANQQISVEKGYNRVSPFMIPNLLIDSAAGKIAIDYGLQGINHSVVSACSSGSLACGEAYEIIRRGDADIMLVGGSEAAILPNIVAGFDVMGALSRLNDNPAGACRPFDAERDGFVMSEGSVMLVMETEEHARARGAKVYAEVVGYGCSADAYHMAAPHETGRGAVDAMRMALRKAKDYGIAPEDVDYVNAHGTATRLNDKGETMAIKEVFGEHAYELSVSSTKSMTGHLLGGAGALEVLFCAKAIETGVVPPTINYENPDPECDLDCTPNVAKQADVQVTLSNNFGFGGHNACVMLRQYTNGQQVA